MRELFSVFGRNRTTAFGAVLVFASGTMFILLVGVDIAGLFENPYTNLIVYVAVPFLLFLGLVIVPIGAINHRRYVRKHGDEKVEQYFRFDFNEPKMRHRGWFFAGWTMLFGAIMATAAYKGNHHMESAAFCGETCHTVMQPEYTAYLRSPHARVPCVDCHIGPGLPWLLRQKFTGLRQTIHTLTNTYERPIASPVKDLRPAREVCEVCHWPNRFYGDRTQLIYTYAEDEANTPELTRLMLHVGHHAAESTGIHSHVAKQIWYAAKDPKRMEMSWLYERRPNGDVVTWAPEGTTLPANAGPNMKGTRLMDCVDCHNRSAHRFDSFDKLVDDALTRGDLKLDLPWTKKLAMEAVPKIEKPISFAEQRSILAKLNEIPKEYQARYPDIYKARATDVKNATATLVQLFLGTAFPAMKVYPDMQADLKTHDGCLRCHGALVAMSGPKKGETLSDDCELCHSEPQTIEGAAARPR
jgi:hypothetical protein